MLETRSQDERRSTRRILNESVFCTHKTRTWEACFVDISPEGAFIESRLIPKLGSEIYMVFTLPLVSKSCRIRFRMKGRVCRIESRLEEDPSVLSPIGFGVEFASISPKENAGIFSFVQEGGNLRERRT